DLLGERHSRGRVDPDEHVRIIIEQYALCQWCIAPPATRPPRHPRMPSGAVPLHPPAVGPTGGAKVRHGETAAMHRWRAAVPDGERSGSPLVGGSPLVCGAVTPYRATPVPRTSGGGRRPVPRAGSTGRGPGRRP